MPYFSWSAEPSSSSSAFITITKLDAVPRKSNSWAFCHGKGGRGGFVSVILHYNFFFFFLLVPFGSKVVSFFSTYRHESVCNPVLGIAR